MPRFAFLTRERERELIRRYQKTGCRDAMTELVDSQTALALKLIAKLARAKSIAMTDELRAEAPLAVFDSVRRFDLSRGTRLASAVGWSVRNRILRFYDGGAIRVTYDQAKRHPERAASARGAMSIGEADLDVSDGGRLDPARVATDAETKLSALHSLHDAVALLPDRERLVITSRFFEDKTLKQVGETMGVSRERVRQLEQRGLKLLRNFLSSEKTARRRGDSSSPRQGTKLRLMWDTLRKHDGMRPRELADATGLSPRSVKAMLYNRKFKYFVRRDGLWYAASQ